MRSDLYQSVVYKVKRSINTEKSTLKDDVMQIGDGDETNQSIGKWYYYKEVVTL